MSLRSHSHSFSNCHMHVVQAIKPNKARVEYFRVEPVVTAAEKGWSLELDDLHAAVTPLTDCRGTTMKSFHYSCLSILSPTQVRVKGHWAKCCLHTSRVLFSSSFLQSVVVLTATLKGWHFWKSWFPVSSLCPSRQDPNLFSEGFVQPQSQVRNDNPPVESTTEESPSALLSFSTCNPICCLQTLGVGIENKTLT